jgi:glucose/mannose-6-phosphate isomerase
VIGSGVLAPVARRGRSSSTSWRDLGQFDLLPEANHTTLAGLLLPEDQLGRTMIISCAPRLITRNRLRSDNTPGVHGGRPEHRFYRQGDSTLANQWTALHFGDYMAYYLAMA